MNTSNKGQLAVLKIQQRAMEKGCIVSVPTTESVYDLLIECNHKILRVQCKYGDGKVSEADGSVRIEFSKREGNSKYKHGTYTSQEVDLILAYVPRIDKILAFPPSIFEGKRMICIRTELPKNNQKKGIRFADDFIW
jgi:hypothetical protein